MHARGALPRNLVHIHKPRPAADHALNAAQDLAQIKGRRTAIIHAQQVQIGMPQALEQVAPVVAAIFRPVFLQLQQGLKQSVKGRTLQRVAHGHVDVLVGQMVQHRHEQGAVCEHDRRGKPVRSG